MPLFHSLDYLATCVPGKLGINGADAMVDVLRYIKVEADSSGASETEVGYYEYLITQIVEWKKTREDEILCPQD